MSLFGLIMDMCKTFWMYNLQKCIYNLKKNLPFSSKFMSKFDVIF